MTRHSPLQGLVVNARQRPQDMQEATYEKGLFPYVPKPEARPCLAQ